MKPTKVILAFDNLSYNIIHTEEHNILESNTRSVSLSQQSVDATPTHPSSSRDYSKSDRDRDRDCEHERDQRERGGSGDLHR